MMALRGGALRGDQEDSSLPNGSEDPLKKVLCGSHLACSSACLSCEDAGSPPPEERGIRVPTWSQQAALTRPTNLLASRYRTSRPPEWERTSFRLRYSVVEAHNRGKLWFSTKVIIGKWGWECPSEPEASLDALASCLEAPVLPASLS